MFGLCPNILSFHWFLLVFILKKCPKIGVLFLPEFLSNQRLTLAQWFLGIEVCYIFFGNSQLFFRIYSEFSGSLCESMSNFDGLLLVEFLSNRLQTFKAQWSLGIEVLCYYFFTVLLPAALTMRPRPSPLSDSVCSELVYVELIHKPRKDRETMD